MGTPGIITLFIILSLLSACDYQEHSHPDSLKQLAEGTLIYHVSGEETNASWEFEVLFQKNQVIIDEKYAFGTGVKYMYDIPANEVLGLISEAVWPGEEITQFVSYYTPNEIVKNAMSRNPNEAIITKTDSYKDILGYKCQKIIIEQPNQHTATAWITDKITTGIIYPWTPLALEYVALEYELVVAGTTKRKYIINSISSAPIHAPLFDHIVPDAYHVNVPMSQFSVGNRWKQSREAHSHKSLSHPYLNTNPEETKSFIEKELDKIIPNTSENAVIISFDIHKDGSVSDMDIQINNSNEDLRIEEVRNFFKTTGQWNPALIRGQPVRSRVKMVRMSLEPLSIE